MPVSEDVKAMIAEALNHTIGDVSKTNEAEFVARNLEALANMIRADVVHGFDWKWKQGAGVIDATNLHMPKVPIDFISLTINIGEENADGESTKEA